MCQTYETIRQMAKALIESGSAERIIIAEGNFNEIGQFPIGQQ